MRIAHVSDLHIRNFKYREEYRTAFRDLYGKLGLLRPDLIVNTGDTVHSKLAVSPELFDDVADHMLAMSSIAPYWLVLGNHDLNLKNQNRTDAISPIVRALQGRTTHELKLLSQGMYRLTPGRFVFWNYDIRGHRDFRQTHVIDGEDVNIGLYHGSISGCVTDQGFVMEEGEAELDKFSGMDFVLLGDIHKRQSFRDGRVQYPGSLIQQNYGEELVKGFLLWDIRSKSDFSVDFHSIETPGRFFTIQVPASLDTSGISVPLGSRIKAIVDGGLSPSKRIRLEEDLGRFKPLEVITPDVTDDRSKVEAIDVDRLVGSREELMRGHLTDLGIGAQGIDLVLKLFRQYESALDSDGTSRGTTWQLKRIAWDNMMNYGEGNSIDFTKLSGLVGIFAPNASGKSSIFDILLQALFDKVSKEVPRNIDLVNDNKDTGEMTVEFESMGRPYGIVRRIERIHYGQRKFTETKQWGETTLDFSSDEESLNGATRPETERSIRTVIGNFEDFVLTAMISQNPIFGLPGGADILNCRETDRRKILFRFLDLDVYERIAAAVKDDLRVLMGKLSELDSDSLQAQLQGLLAERERAEQSVFEARAGLRSLEESSDVITSKLDRANARDLQKLASEQRELRARRIKQVSALSSAVKDGKTRHDHLFLLAGDRGRHLAARPPEGSVALDVLHRRMAELRRGRENAVAALAGKEQRLAQGMRSLKTLDGIPCEGKYPTCKFISEASSFVLQRQEIEEAIGMLISKRDGTTDEITSLERFEIIHKDFLNWQQGLSGLDLEILRCEQSLAAATAEIRKLETEASMTSLRLAELDLMLHASALDDIKRLEVEQRGLAKQIRSARDSIDATLRSIGGLDSRVDRLRSDLRDLDGLAGRVETHERLLEMCGKNGLPYRILSLVLPVINAEISKILSGVVKFNVFFEADQEKQTVSLFIRYGDYRSRPLSLGSGAEKFIASLAVRMALLSVSSLPKTDVLIIDEGFGRLDPEHLEALQRMLEYLRNAFGSVFIVSHVDSMRDIVDHSIEIVSQDGYAHVEVG